MPRVFDNIDLPLLPALQHTLSVSDRADFCVGYFNLRGWRHLDRYLDRWHDTDGVCRLLIGMQKPANEELRTALALGAEASEIDQQTAVRHKRRIATELRDQLTYGAPTNEDEIALRQLARRLRAGKLKVKLFLRHSLHAKLYLLFRPDPINPIVGYLGSSNLTLAGLVNQGELNLDVLDSDATEKLARWFEDRWNDRFCIDISTELAEIIEESWARETLIPPYHIYLKMAWHLSADARAGLLEFSVPKELKDILFDYQANAVQMAASYLQRRGGVMLGDVVGLGKTLMATALCKLMQNEHDLSTVILCPKNLVKMWDRTVAQYGLTAKIIPFSKAQRELPHVPARFRLVLIDESHNLRNREGRRYKAIHDHVRKSGSKVVLLSATPYNKSYLDLASQLRLFLDENDDLGIRPEQAIKRLGGEAAFEARFQCPAHSLRAFEKSEDEADDWRELMRLFLVRRTRSFIQQNYASFDAERQRHYLTTADGSRRYFPLRKPITVPFAIDDADPADQYARLYSDAVVDTVGALKLPRYGLGNYVMPMPTTIGRESEQLANLSRAGKRLMGFCRTNLFKRLESSGFAFLQSVSRHVLRNFVYLHAIERGLPLPIGTQDSSLLDARFTDADSLFDTSEGSVEQLALGFDPRGEDDFRKRAERLYRSYQDKHANKFDWLRPALFVEQLAKDLSDDNARLMRVLHEAGDWQPARDAKLIGLMKLVRETHATEKLLIFTQFADTADYLGRQLGLAHVTQLGTVTGQTEDPTNLAWRFSPDANDARGFFGPEQHLRVLVATDILSEGQNLQDAHIVVNYDLPWAIIRLIQRAGRVDRIGQIADTIRCYSFLPADGVERIINLRARVRLRLRQNAEVVGSDESFFEDDADEQVFRDLYTEKAGVLDDAEDSEVDLSSMAWQIWQNAIAADPPLEALIPALPDVVLSSRLHAPTRERPEGVLVYLKTGDGHDALAYVDRTGQSITESQFEILKAAECAPETPAQPHHALHHPLVQQAVEHVRRLDRGSAGALGGKRKPRAVAYNRLKHLASRDAGGLFANAELVRVIDELYRFPLLEEANHALARQINAGIKDEDLARLVLALRADNRLCHVLDEHEAREPRIICSMGLFAESPA